MVIWGVGPAPLGVAILADFVFFLPLAADGYSPSLSSLLCTLSPGGAAEKKQGGCAWTCLETRDRPETASSFGGCS
ncbi:hypothetical protein OPV22_021160 [Ensete ventricosum]|uniref:Secreted protein n=1 Tax=Ensete ventricosum TaxID=4639 RepID=A0AAV8QRL6_ENSVE|nr:hypothetical protein OPV22_021160 [Ensete ventricosum]